MAHRSCDHISGTITGVISGHRDGVSTRRVSAALPPSPPRPFRPTDANSEVFQLSIVSLTLAALSQGVGLADTPFWLVLLIWLYKKQKGRTLIRPHGALSIYDAVPPVPLAAYADPLPWSTVIAL